MQKSVSLVAVLAACAAASGCQQFSQAIGAEKIAPDEFRVVTQAPLSVPPDFGLRPPRPGDPQATEREAAARTSVFGTDRGQAASPAERLLVARAGAEAVDPNIRARVDFEGASIVRKNEAFADRVLASGAATADPATEQQRLSDAESARRATGGGTVTIRKANPDNFKLPGM